MHDAIRRHIEENIRVKEAMLESMGPAIETAVRRGVETFRSGGKILFCGNGGSAADAQHLATEFVVRYRGSVDRPALPALALSVDSSTLTAAANDFSVAQMFSRQVEAHGQPSDLLVAISTSGNSPNVIEAVRTAKTRDIVTIGLLGGSGGALAELVDIALIVPSATTARIQEAHILIGHIFCELIEDTLFPGPR